MKKFKHYPLTEFLHFFLMKMYRKKMAKSQEDGNSQGEILICRSAENTVIQL